MSEEFESVQMWKANEEEDKFSGKIKSATVRAFGLEKEDDLFDPRWIPFRYSEQFLSQLGKIGFIIPKADAFYRATMAFYQKLRRAQGVPGATLNLDWQEVEDHTHLAFSMFLPKNVPKEAYEGLKQQKEKNLKFLVSIFDAEAKEC